MNKTKGDLIKLALEGEFDLIIHGCNIKHRKRTKDSHQVALHQKLRLC